ncbi:sensor histidine kinase [uncultured Jatrophihabitans sp.]|uniref:sensor histidine kinase n=1 Tax=uncultured Jatrophihabitans sp. TaxID=1610747 RepID=UPI0035C94696
MAITSRSVAASARAHGDAIAAATLAVLWLTGLSSGHVPSTRWQLFSFTVCGVLMSVPFAWRRRAPVVTAGLTFAGGALYSLVVSHELPIAFVLTALLASYSLGAHAIGRTSWIAIVVVLAVVGVMNAPTNDAGVAGLFLTPLAFILVPWAVGRLVGRLRTERGALQRLTAQLEREQAEVARASVVEERARIARELHDIVAHSISVMVVQAGAAQQFVDPDGRAQAPLDAIRHTGQQALVEMRRLLGILRTEDGTATALAPQPGLGSLDALLDTSRTSGLTVSVEVHGDATPLPLGVDVAAFRLIQESLSNIRKHARADRADVTLSYTPTCLTLEVVDDGVSTQSGPAGHGLIGMRERVSLYGGRLECGPRPEGGWRVRAQLPLVG